MFQITPIGSCRVAGPLQLAQKYYGFGVNKGRSYGYCHSSGEAVQQAEFMLGSFKPPKEIWPLIARGVSFDTITQQKHTLSDLYIVELSSTKRITIDGVFLQLNYLTNAYRSFFADQPVARSFWNVVSEGTQKEIDIFLSRHSLDPADQALLRRVRMSATAPAQLAQDIKALTALLPRLLIVTHVNARRPCGARLNSRAAFIAMVKDTAQRNGVSIYDPTLRMLEMGQQEAIADFSEGLAHYTDEFAKQLVNDWSSYTIAPAIDDMVMRGQVQNIEDKFVPHAFARIRDGAYDEIGLRLKRLQQVFPQSKALDGVANSLCNAKNDAEGAYSQLDPIPVETASLRQKLTLAFDLRKFNDIRRLVKALEADDALPSTRHLLQMGRTAAEQGYALVAMTILSTALDAAPDSATAAELLAKLLLQHGKEALTVLPFATRQRLLASTSPLLQLRLSDAGQWEHKFDMERISAYELTEMVAHLTLTDDLQRGGVLIATWRNSQAKTIPLPREIIAMLDRWCERANKTNDRVIKIGMLNAVLAADPQNGSARIAMRNIRRGLRDELREAAAKRDKKRLDAIVAPNKMLPLPLTELDLYRARERFEAEDYQAALKIGLSASRMLPNNISVWVLLMRASVRTNDLLSIDRFAQRVIVLSDRDTAKLESEAIEHLHRNAIACGVAAKHETNSRKAANLQRISDRHTPVFRHKKAVV